LIKFNKSYYNLPINIQQLIIEFVEVTHKFNIISIIHFGSKNFTKISDVDLIIVVNGIENNEIKEIRRKLKLIEIKYGFRSITKSLIGNILNLIEEDTGMFCSNFVCNRQDLIEGKFSKIFHTNRFLTYLLIPTNIVFLNIFSSYKIIYGEEINHLLPQFDINYFQYIKSILMCFILSIISILLLFVSKDATKYAMEAVKWSLHNTYFYHNRNSMTTEELISLFIDKGFKHLIRLQQLRMNYKKDVFFNLLSLFLVVKIHMYRFN